MQIFSRFLYLASPCKALQPGDFKEGNDREHNGCQSIDGQPVLLQNMPGVSQLLIDIKTEEEEEGSQPSSILFSVLRWSMLSMT